jgi:hypothetical protein
VSALEVCHCSVACIDQEPRLPRRVKIAPLHIRFWVVDQMQQLRALLTHLRTLLAKARGRFAQGRYPHVVDGLCRIAVEYSGMLTPLIYENQMEAGT